MGRDRRERPARLAEKLLHIRTALGLSQTAMLDRLGVTDSVHRNYLSDFERGVREPSLPLLLKYARVAGVSLDTLADDEADLPKRLPAKPRRHS